MRGSAPGEGSSSIGRGHRSGSSIVANDDATDASPSLTESDDVIAALDQGTQSTRVFLYRASDMAVVASHQVELTQHFPRPGWVEHDPMEILSSVALCAGGAVAAARAASRSNLTSSSSAASSKPPRVVALGITNQRESTIAWDRSTGAPLHRSIVWNDGRTAEICARVEEEHGGKDCFRAVTGLPVSPYFSAYKMLWLLENVPAVKKAAEEGKLALGTVDSWLIFHLTGGSRGKKEGGSSSSPSASDSDPTFVTDVTNASRTGLMCLGTREWHAGTCAKLGIDPSWLPRIASSAEIYGKVVAPPASSENIAEMVRDKASLYRTYSGEFGFASDPSSSPSSEVISWGCRALAGVPISGCLGDQQAALLGQRCRVGEAKATYGTGAFVLLVTGSSDGSGGKGGGEGAPGPVASSSGLLTTAAYQLGKDAPLFYALEGAVAVAGAGVSWLRDGLGVIESPREVEELARSVETSGGVVLVPAFAGLLAPRWRSDARGVVVGLTSATTRAHLCRAMLDAIGWQTKEVVEAMARDRGSAATARSGESPLSSDSAAEEEKQQPQQQTNPPSSFSAVAAISRLRVDGGASRNDLLMQIQADLLGLPVERPAHGETTSLGAALAAGVGAGIFSAEEAFTVGADDSPAVFLPKAKREDVKKAYAKWNDAVERSYGLA